MLMEIRMKFVNSNAIATNQWKFHPVDNDRLNNRMKSQLNGIIEIKIGNSWIIEIESKDSNYWNN